MRRGHKTCASVLELASVSIDAEVAGKPLGSNLSRKPPTAALGFASRQALRYIKGMDRKDSFFGFYIYGINSNSDPRKYDARKSRFLQAQFSRHLKLRPYINNLQ